MAFTLAHNRGITDGASHHTCCYCDRSLYEATPSSAVLPKPQVLPGFKDLFELVLWGEFVEGIPKVYDQAVSRALLGHEEHSARKYSGPVCDLFVNGESNHHPCPPEHVGELHRGTISIGFAWCTLLCTTASTSEPHSFDTSTETGHAGSRGSEVGT